MSITCRTLKNGLTVYLEENHTAPVISFNALVKVGSACETDKEAGISHFIEHMLFKGTQRRPVGAIAREVEASGGDINAYTSFDQTVYYINMASRHASRGLDILADALFFSSFDKNELESEKEVILEEIRRSNDNPYHRISEELFKKSFTTHTYGRPIIGFDYTVSGFSRHDLVTYHHRWYTPGNMAFIVVGDFETEAMFKEIEKVLGKIPARTTAKAVRPVEPVQKKARFSYSTSNVQSSYFVWGFHVPAITHRDVPALDLLSHILGDADSSRLEQVIREKKKLVNQISTYAYTPRDPGLMVISGILPPKNVDKTMPAIWEEIRHIQEKGVTKEELDRARLNIISSAYYEKESVGSQGGKIAYFTGTTDDPLYETHYTTILNQVTCETICDVASRYLTPDNVTMILLEPSTIKKSKPNMATFVPKKRTAPLIKKVFPPKPVVTHLANGATLVVQENSHLPIVATSILTKGGLLYETPANNGINALIANTITKGAAGRSAVDIAKAIEAMAGSIGGTNGRNSLGIKAEFLSTFTHDGFALVADVLCRPDFVKAEVEMEKHQHLDAIRNEEDNLPTVAFKQCARALFGSHPYSLSMMGTPKSVAAMNSQQLSRYYRERLNPSDLVIAVSGDVSMETVKKWASKEIGTLKKPRQSASKWPTIHAPKEPVHVETIKNEKEQSHIVVAYIAPGITSRDYYPLMVMNNILSGQGGRLFFELRDKKGLAYTVSSVYQPGIGGGLFGVYIGTEPGKTNIAIEGIGKELDKISTKPVTNEELSRAREYLIGANALDRQKNLSVAGTHAVNVFYGIGVDEINRFADKVSAVTANDILRVAKHMLVGKAHVLSIVRPG